jgi:lysophospholipase L1-like esterase
MRTSFPNLVPAVFGALLLCASADPPPPAPGYPDPERLESEVLAFEESDRSAPPPSGAVLCLGSSSMRMWHEHLASDLSPLTVVPRGFGGSTMYDALFYLPRIVLDLLPRALLLYEGDNDIDFGVSPEGVRETFDEFVREVRRSLPGVRIYVISIKPSPARWALWPEMREANRLLAFACGGDSLLTFVDVATPMLGENGLPRGSLFLPDSLHMNEDGYAVWRSAIRPVLLENEEGREETETPVGKGG